MSKGFIGNQFMRVAQCIEAPSQHFQNKFPGTVVAIGARHARQPWTAGSLTSSTGVKDLTTLNNISKNNYSS